MHCSYSFPEVKTVFKFIQRFLRDNPRRRMLAHIQSAYQTVFRVMLEFVQSSPINVWLVFIPLKSGHCHYQHLFDRNVFRFPGYRTSPEHNCRTKWSSSLPCLTNVIRLKSRAFHQPRFLQNDGGGLPRGNPSSCLWLFHDPDRLLIICPSTRLASRGRDVIGRREVNFFRMIGPQSE